MWRATSQQSRQLSVASRPAVVAAALQLAKHPPTHFMGQHEPLQYKVTSFAIVVWARHKSLTFFGTALPPVAKYTEGAHKQHAKGTVECEPDNQHIQQFGFADQECKDAHGLVSSSCCSSCLAHVWLKQACQLPSCCAPVGLTSEQGSQRTGAAACSSARPGAPASPPHMW